MRKFRYRKWLNWRLWKIQKELNKIAGKVDFLELLQRVESELRRVGAI
jgi:hypothetical protein